MATKIQDTYGNLWTNAPVPTTQIEIASNKYTAIGALPVCPLLPQQLEPSVSNSSDSKCEMVTPCPQMRRKYCESCNSMLPISKFSQGQQMLHWGWCRYCRMNNLSEPPKSHRDNPTLQEPATEYGEQDSNE